MPSTTPKQKRTMQWVAHDPAASAKLGIPQDVAREYVAADKKAPAFATGGPVLPRSGGLHAKDAAQR